MALSVIRHGLQYGLWDSQANGYIYGPQPQHLCFRKKQLIEDQERLQQEAAYREELREHCIKALTDGGLSREDAYWKLREERPELFQAAAIDPDTGKFI